VQIGQEVNEKFDLKGSGYQIGPGLVLTSHHVIEQIKAEVHVRRQSDMKGNNPTASSFPATIIWSGIGMDEDYDLVILKLKGAAIPQNFACGPAEMRSLLEEECEDKQKRCIGYGFPIGKMIGSNPRHSKALGDLQLTLYADGPLFEFLLEVRGAPSERKGWQGLSGAALYDIEDENSTIIAVVRSSLDSVDNLRLAATILPPRKLGDKDDPTGFWRAAGQPVQKIGANFARQGLVIRKSSSALDYIHILDRGDQDDLVRAGFDMRQGGNPAVVLFHGRSEDEPQDYPFRYTSGELDFPFWRDYVQPVVPELSWPYALVSEGGKGAALSRLKERLAENALTELRQGITTAALGRTSAAADFQRYFANGLLPHIHQIHLDERMDDRQFAELREFLDFFASAANSAALNCLFIGLTYKPDGGEDAQFQKKAFLREPLSPSARRLWLQLTDCAGSLTDRLHVWLAGGLSQVDVSDVYSWENFLTRKSLGPKGAIFNHLRTKLLTGSQPLMHIRTIVTELEQRTV
jgi:hypothetical protein